ncbi:MAG: PKD domain-containing protein [Thermoplasmata archaeon]|nr:PKD domain-containing protein [Thermoplasmata archaeon]NIS10953.1 PKD domain-containing protein [Thermoplasmata archaeon]NIS18464.1 PKD domain-containing protein [Thermoplasmata archaeon]NIT75931.1 PKD domain-containing protein [Thermoplasmata archaeon]NIU47620.1 PKD domain-containing protein [Thermoplasmata archaeon]
MNVSTLAIYRWVVTDQEAGWEYLEDSMVDTAEGMVMAPIPSLQNDIYTVLGNKENPPPNNPPVAIITVDGVTYSPDATVQKSYRSGEVIRFDGSKSYDPDEEALNDYIAYYGWSFGDGESTEGKVAQHSYEVPDKYTVTLTVRDSFGKTHSVSVVITVRDEGDNTLLYFLVLVGIIVILILLFFPKGTTSVPSTKPSHKEPAQTDVKELDEREDEIPDEIGDEEQKELDDIIDELEEGRNPSFHRR